MFVGIPSLDNFRNYSPTFSLHINPSTQGFVFDLVCDSGKYRYESNLTESNLLEINRSLRNKLETLIFAKNKNKEEDLRQLAYQGYNAFINIFKEKKFRDDIISLLQQEGTIFVSIVTKTFFIPWELLYIENPRSSALFDFFWGFKLIVSRVINRDNNNLIRPSTSPFIHYSSRPKLGLVTYSKLASVKDIEIPYFTDLLHKKLISLTHLLPLDPTPTRIIRNREIDSFKSFCKEDFDIVHFACHAKYKEASTKDSHIKISDNFFISIMDFENEEIEITGAPLIILNACETGNFNPLYSSNSSIAENFLQQGALGVVATELEIPDESAAKFIQFLYANLLNHNPLGISLLNARREYLKKYSHAIGLLYSMYASPILQLIKQN